VEHGRPTTGVAMGKIQRAVVVHISALESAEARSPKAACASFDGIREDVIGGT